MVTELMASGTHRWARSLARLFAITTSTQLVLKRSLSCPLHPDVFFWPAPAQIDVEFNPTIVKIAGRVTFAGRVRSFMDFVKLVAEVIFTGRVRSFLESVRLVAELFVKLAPGPCHQVLKLMRFIANVARPKNSKLR